MTATRGPASATLLVTQSARSIGEFRRGWVRWLYRGYCRSYRRAVTAAVRELSRTGSVTVLAARELVDPTTLPPGVALRYYDEAAFTVDSEELAALTEQIASGWWPDDEPSLRYRDVSLPELIAGARGVLLRLEVAEPLGAVERTIADIAPARVVLLSGASIPERLAAVVAGTRSVPVMVLGLRSVASGVYASGLRWLWRREERRRTHGFLGYPRRSSATPMADGRRVLFVTCRPRHHYVVDPLADALRRAGAVPYVVATPSEEPDLVARIGALARDGVDAGFLTDHLSLEEARALGARWRPRCRALWRRLAADPAMDARLTWRGLPLREVCQPFLRDAVEESLVAGVLFQEAAFRALDAIRPAAVVIASNRRYAERALALAARARGIPCLLFSGTLILGRDRSAMFDVGDRMLVIGEHLKDGLVREQGIDPTRITVVGDPRSNAARLLGREALRDGVIRELGLAPGRPVVAVVSKYVSLLFSIREKEAFYRTVGEAVARLGAVAVVVKAHPNENVPLLREQLRAWGWPDAIVTQGYDVHRLFGAADVAVMVTSMAGIEAMAMGCPVVAVQTPGKDFEGKYMPPYVRERVVERVDAGDAAALGAALARLLSDPATRENVIERGRAFAARYVHPVDGRLALRLLAVAEDVAGEPAAV